MEKTSFKQFLDSHNEAAWAATVTELLPGIHQVDKNAVHIWFRFYPLELFRLLESVEDQSDLVRKFVLQGKYKLVDQIDSSHHFFYGHRYWREVKEAIVTRAEEDTPAPDLAEEIRHIAISVGRKIRVEPSLLIGITAVGVMTLIQVGLEKLRASNGQINIDAKQAKLTAQQVLFERAKNDSQGLLGFLKTDNKKWTITHNENNSKAKFKVINDEEIASAAARDQSENWSTMDARCIEGVIPVECRSAACGTCWVGVLGGAEKLSDVTAREAKSMQRFGYLYSNESKPLLRLACQAKATGAVSIVIPPWNGVFGKYVYGERIAEETLEPATTSAKNNRATVREVTKNQLS